jgi:hypothetical protein
MNSALDRSLNGTIPTAAIGRDIVPAIKAIITEHYSYIDGVTLLHVARWVCDCGMAVIANQ